MFRQLRFNRAFLSHYHAHIFIYIGICQCAILHLDTTPNLNKYINKKILGRVPDSSITLCNHVHPHTEGHSCPSANKLHTHTHIATYVHTKKNIQTHVRLIRKLWSVDK